jgi:hypothetical protein
MVVRYNARTLPYKQPALSCTSAKKAGTAQALARGFIGAKKVGAVMQCKSVHPS